MRLEIDKETMVISVGPTSLDVEMARHLGWSDDEIDALWKQLSEVHRAASMAMNAKRGRTRQCEVCECWTVPGPCHRCAQCHA